MVPPDASPGRRRLQRAWLWGPVALYCGLIFALSSVSDVPALPLGASDKTAHTLLYTGLGALALRALAGGLDRPVRLWMAPVVVAFTLIYGFTDEFHQLFVPRRTFDLLDLAADGVGGVAGSGLAWLWSILRGFSPRPRRGRRV